MVALERIGSITVEQNVKFEQHAKLITFVAAENPKSAKHLRSAVDAAADDLASYARALRAEIPAFTTGFMSGFGAFDVAMGAWIEGKPKRGEILQVLQTLELAISSLRSSREPVIRFRDIIASIPKLTSRLKKAIRATKVQLDELVAGITVVSDRAISMARRFREAGGEMGGSA